MPADSAVRALFIVQLGCVAIGVAAAFIVHIGLFIEYKSKNVFSPSLAADCHKFGQAFASELQIASQNESKQHAH